MHPVKFLSAKGDRLPGFRWVYAFRRRCRLPKETAGKTLGPSIRKYAHVFTHSGLSAACDEPFDSEFTAEWLNRYE